MKTKSTFVPSGFMVTSFVQLYPPAAVSALALCSEIQSIFPIPYLSELIIFTSFF